LFVRQFFFALCLLIVRKKLFHLIVNCLHSSPPTNLNLNPIRRLQVFVQTEGIIHGLDLIAVHPYDNISVPESHFTENGIGPDTG